MHHPFGEAGFTPCCAAAKGTCCLWVDFRLATGRLQGGERVGPSTSLIYSKGKQFLRTDRAREGDPMNSKKTSAADFLIGYAVLVGVLVAIAVLLAPASAFAASAPLEAGFYSAQVETAADDSVTDTVDSPCLLEVASTGEMVARIAWSSNDVVRMVVNDVQYLPTSNDISEYVIPVSALDEPLSAQVELRDQPEKLISVQLTFAGATVDDSDEALDALASSSEYEVMPLSLSENDGASANMEAAANSQEANASVEWYTFAGWAIIAVAVVGVAASIFIRIRRGK